MPPMIVLNIANKSVLIRLGALEYVTMDLALLNLNPVLVSKSWRSLLEFLGFTAAIALMSGFGFGLALRSQANLSNSAPSPFHSEQNFPPRADWPISGQSSGGTAENPNQTSYNSLQNQP